MQAWALVSSDENPEAGRSWIAEMYGFSFACAMSDVWHQARNTTLLYNGYGSVGKNSSTVS